MIDSPIRRVWIVLVLCVLACGRAGRGQGYAPSAAAQHFEVAPGLRASLYAHEPDVRQAIFVKCDDRGRVWTIQYLQYPNPAGLQRIKVDRWSRTVYDRVPDPPPHGPRGDDRITILSDANQDGIADQFRDFISGLNLVTGVEFGQGGVYVLQVPYLLFYPDENRDDVPDGPPRVLLSGFGMEDAQSLSNHLTWGPDGWLYGVNGSTTTCQIRDYEFQQGVWRYHPQRDEFELFCEGGSNCFGVTFDELGNLFYSTNGGPFVTALQGAYYFKSFGKHGPLHNRFAYHYFANMECDQIPGGPPTGGTIYRGTGLPEAYRGKFLAGNFLGHTASAWSIEQRGATFRAKWDGYLFQSHDTWCGPTDLCLGPHGEIYVADFFDQRTAHPDPDANWDRSNGRIYRIDQPTTERGEIADIRGRSTDELVALQRSNNGWLADRARVELSSRRDADAVAQLDALVRTAETPTLALRGLWGRYGMQGLPERLALEWIDHPAPAIRSWIVRLAADQHQLTPALANRVAQLAENETSIPVRAQLAASARRLPPEQGLPIIWALLRTEDQQPDERVEWSAWWALERYALEHVDRIAATWEAAEAWEHLPLRRCGVLLVRRYAAEGTLAGYNASARLLSLAPPAIQGELYQAVALGLAERSATLGEIGQGGLFEEHAEKSSDSALGPATPEVHYQAVQGPLQSAIESYQRQHPGDLLGLELGLRANLAASQSQLRDSLRQALPSSQKSGLVPWIALVGRFGQESVLRELLPLIHHADFEVQQSALSALARLDSPEVPESILAAYGESRPEIQAAMRDVLFQRPGSSLAFLRWWSQASRSPEEVPLAQVRRLALHHHPEIDAFIRTHWGNVGPGTPEEKLAVMRRFNNDLRAAEGDPAAGKGVFSKQCSKCHRLFGEGGQVGPDLTGTSRQDRASLLANIVDPSAVVRREYLNYVVQTTSGQVLTGLLAEQDGGSVTILDAEGKRVRIPRDEIEQLAESTVSLMPEKLLEALSPQELRDLFAYLQRSS